MKAQKKWLVITKTHDHIEGDTFTGEYEKIMEDVLRFTKMYDQEVVSITRIYDQFYIFIIIKMKLTEEKIREHIVKKEFSKLGEKTTVCLLTLDC